MADTLMVLQSFIGKVDKAEVSFRAGDLIKADHPAVKKWPQFFGDAHHPHEIEQATAAPGEKRK